MPFDWLRLDPDLALPPGDERYVPRPWGAGDRLATLLEGRLGPIAVTGPVGSGKTTELHRAAAVSKGPAWVVDVTKLVDDWEELSPKLLLFLVAEHAVQRYIATEMAAGAPSDQLVKNLRATDPRLSRGNGLVLPTPILAMQALREVEKLLGRGRITLLFDGIDDLPDPQAHALVRGLLELRDHANVAVVVSPSLANGPAAHDVLSAWRVFQVPAVPADDPKGLRWLGDVARKRLGDVPKDVAPVVDRAGELSGGLARLFLRLVHDAGQYADSLGREAPDDETLSEAARDQADVFRRLVVAGDVEALRDADGTSGMEVPEDRRVRFLSQSLLVEYPHREDVVVRAHPLLARMLGTTPGKRAATRATARTASKRTSKRKA